MTHSETAHVTLVRASDADAVLLGNLMELYIHDLSALFSQVKLGNDGRFGYPELPLYLTGEGKRCAFIVHYAGCVAGFVLVRRGSPASEDPSVLDIAEFFVLRQFRRRGVGGEAAALLFRQMPGRWTIRASARNLAAIDFWRGLVARYTPRATESARVIGKAEWLVFCFDNSVDVDAE